MPGADNAIDWGYACNQLCLTCTVWIIRRPFEQSLVDFFGVRNLCSSLTASPPRSRAAFAKAGKRRSGSVGFETAVGFCLCGKYRHGQANDSPLSATVLKMFCRRPEKFSPGGLFICQPAAARRQKQIFCVTSPAGRVWLTKKQKAKYTERVNRLLT